jgi:uncharacterized protein YjiS (DUF1127 family)
MTLNHTTTANHGPEAAHTGTLFAVAAFPLRIARSLWEFHRRRRDYRTLLTMPDYLLEDVGVTREQVIAEMKARLF